MSDSNRTAEVLDRLTAGIEQLTVVRAMAAAGLTCRAASTPTASATPC